MRLAINACLIENIQPLIPHYHRFLSNQELPVLYITKTMRQLKHLMMESDEIWGACMVMAHSMMRVQSKAEKIASLLVFFRYTMRPSRQNGLG